MATSSSYENGESSGSQNRFEYQVFLSFRGADVRKGWIDHMSRRLKEEGVRVFLDNNDLEHGKKIDLLFQAIERSQIFLVTFSPGYADSRWCLDELVKIMDCMANNSVGPQQQHVLPVFYNVEPTDVRHQTGPYEQAFKAHQNDDDIGGIVTKCWKAVKALFKVHENDDDTCRVTKYRKALFKAHQNDDDIGRVTKYREALQQVTQLKGLCLKEDANGYEGQLVENVIKEVKNRVHTRKLFVPRNFVGRNDILQNINMWLQDGSNDAQVGMIYGPGGIGKSTVALIVYNHNLGNFSGSCFLADFQREATQGRGLTHLLKQIISDISKKSPEEIYNVLTGLTQVQAVVSCRKILLVLDGVDELTQLGAIFDKPWFFHPGSKIIITTRNQELRKVCKFKMEFGISGLRNDESTKLFSLHAFRSDQPPQEFMTLSKKFIDYCQGLPLALRVLGSSLYGDAKDIWESMLEKLAKEPNREVQSILKVSFDSIKDRVTKDLFLHIAHYFVWMRKDDAFRILEGLGLHPRVGFPQLVNRCLVTDSYGLLSMHQLLQEMAREVVREEAPNKPGKRSRLSDFEDSYKVLKSNKGTGNVRCLRVYFHEESVGVHLTPSTPTTILGDPPVKHVVIPTDAFTKMENLELLRLYCVQLTGGYSDFPKELRWFLWERCPLKSIPSDLELDELVVLDMEKSSLVHVWENTKELPVLKVINLSHSTDLVDTPDFSGCLALERIDLQGCSKLVEIHGSVTRLGRLIHINLDGCTNLLSTPDFSGCSALEDIDLEGCSKLVEIHGSITRLGRLTHINLGGCTNLVSTPNFSGCSTLEDINLKGCSKLVEIHGSVTQLGRLTHINLSYCTNLVSTPDISGCSALEYINLKYCSKLVEIHGSITLLSALTRLKVSGCKSLRRISRCTAATVAAFKCKELVEIGDNIKLESMTNMDACRTEYMGYAGLESFVTGDGDGPFGCYKGVYQCGLYSVFLAGDHSANWFNSMTPGPILNYIVPIPSHPDRPIRALNICCVYESTIHSPKVTIGVHNGSSRCTWRYLPILYPIRAFIKSRHFTWLTHWPITQHRELNAGDMLEITFHGRCFECSQTFHESCSSQCVAHPTKYGIHILYEDEATEEVANNVQSCNSLGNNGEGPSGESVANWYDNTFRRADLSTYEREPGVYMYQDRSIYL